MPARNHDLHGNAPDKSSVALLIIDAINDLEWDGGEKIRDSALQIANCIATLKKKAKASKIPTVYVNDNFGKWQSDFKKIIDHCINDDTRGKEIVEILRPDVEDYFVLKPKHSGFFSSTLDTLLEYLGATTLILTGLQTNICVLFTANDCYMRDFNIFVPQDCVAAVEKADHEYALRQIEIFLKADIRPSTEIDLEVLKNTKE